MGKLWYAMLFLVVAFSMILGLCLGSCVFPHPDSTALRARYDNGYHDGYSQGWAAGIKDSQEATEYLEYSVSPGLIEVTVDGSHPDISGEPVRVTIRNSSSASHKFKIEAEAPLMGQPYNAHWYDIGNPSWFKTYEANFDVGGLRATTICNVLMVPEYVKNGKYVLHLKVSSPDSQTVGVVYVCKVLITVKRGG